MENGMNSLENWRHIWASKKADKGLLSDSNDMETIFMELKRIDGNDTLSGGVTYSAFKKQYELLSRYIKGDREKVDSIFEAGCGSGPFLFLFQSEGKQVGGIDYSETHVETAKEVLDSPLELYCTEAAYMGTNIKYDCVFTNSMFEYFPDYDYATKVLERMYDKSLYSVAVLDVHDATKEEAYLTYRRSIIDNYDEKYKGLGKLFYDKSYFVNFAASHDMDIRITTSKLEGYWNKEFVFDIYLYKNN